MYLKEILLLIIFVSIAVIRIASGKDSLQLVCFDIFVDSKFIDKEHIDYDPFFEDGLSRIKNKLTEFGATVSLIPVSEQSDLNRRRCGQAGPSYSIYIGGFSQSFMFPLMETHFGTQRLSLNNAIFLERRGNDILLIGKFLRSQSIQDSTSRGPSVSSTTKGFGYSLSTHLCRKRSENIGYEIATYFNDTSVIEAVVEFSLMLQEVKSLEEFRLAAFDNGRIGNVVDKYLLCKDSLANSRFPKINEKLNMDSLQLARLKQAISGMFSGHTYPSIDFPPPLASSKIIIKDSIFITFSTLGDVSDYLVGLLLENGFEYVSFYHCPGGFALVSELEEIDEYGFRVSKPHNTRRKPMSFSDYLSNLFFGKRGRYRMFSFIYSEIPFHLDLEDHISEEYARAFVARGANKLSVIRSKDNNNSNFTLTVLVYEFVSVDGLNGQLILPPESIPARAQLINSGIMLIDSN